jgi:hypothetical protein
MAHGLMQSRELIVSDKANFFAERILYFCLCPWSSITNSIHEDTENVRK